MASAASSDYCNIQLTEAQLDRWDQLQEQSEREARKLDARLAQLDTDEGTFMTVPPCGCTHIWKFLRCPGRGLKVGESTDYDVCDCEHNHGVIRGIQIQRGCWKLVRYPITEEWYEHFADNGVPCFEIKNSDICDIKL